MVYRVRIITEWSEIMLPMNFRPNTRSELLAGKQRAFYNAFQIFRPFHILLCFCDFRSNNFFVKLDIHNTTVQRNSRATVFRQLNLNKFSETFHYTNLKCTVFRHLQNITRNK